MLIFILQNNLKLNEYLHQSPTGHPNQIYKANKRQTLHVVRQYLQIFHKKNKLQIFFTLKYIFKKIAPSFCCFKEYHKLINISQKIQ